MRIPPVAALVATVAAAATVALSIGSTPIALLDVLDALVGRGDPLLVRIVREIRLPAVLLGLAAGAFLGAGGAVVQGLLRNPLADPYLLGISGGAGVATALGIAFGLPEALGGAALPVAAVGGAALAVALLDRIASLLARGGTSSGPHSLLLAGVLLNALAGSLLLVIHLFVDPTRSHQLLYVLMGDVDPLRTASAPAFVAAGTGLVALAVAWLLGPVSDALTFGDDHARAVGVHPARSRRLLLAMLSLLAGSAVALAGLLGFVGLVVPHLVRPFTGVRLRAVLPAAALAGAAFVVAADTVARSAFPLLGTALPTGAVTSLVGAPFFLVLLVRGSPHAQGAP